MSSRPTHGWCPSCREYSAIDAAERCLWCGGRTEQRRRKGGWKRPDLAGSRYSEAQLRALHVFHTRDRISINELARRTFEQVGYKTHGAAATAIGREWKRLGLKSRDRIEQTVISSTKHGRKRRRQTKAEQNAYRRWLSKQRGWKAIKGAGQPTCEGVKEHGTRKGDPCERPAKENSRFCPAHDPETSASRRAHLDQVHAQTRARLAATALPMGPFAAYVKRRWDELGSLRATAAALDLHPTAVSTYARGLGSNKQPKPTIQLATVERVLEADGRVLEDLYAPEPEAVAA
jgi:hypothetical protein